MVRTSWSMLLATAVLAACGEGTDATSPDGGRDAGLAPGPGDASVDGDAPTGWTGWIETTVSSTVVRIEDTPVQATVSCRYHSDPPTAAPIMAIAVQPAAPVANGTVTFSAPGVYDVRCTAGSLVGTTSVLVGGASMPSYWADAGAAMAGIARAAGDVLLADAQNDAKGIQAALLAMGASSVQLQSMMKSHAPAVWGWPGGYPDAPTLTSAGMPTAADDPATLAALGDAASAMSELRAGYAAAVAQALNAKTLLAQADGHLASAMAALAKLHPSAQAAIVNRELLRTFAHQSVLTTYVAFAAAANAIGTQELSGKQHTLSLLLTTAGFLLGGGAEMAMVNSMYGWAFDWIENAVASMAAINAISKLYQPSPLGPDVWSINTSNVIHAGDQITIWGDRFSKSSENNIVLIVSGNDVQAAWGLADGCLKKLTNVPDPKKPTFAWDLYKYIDAAAKCASGALQGLPPDSTGQVTGAGPVLAEPMNPYGPMHYSIGTLPVPYSGQGLPSVIGFIPINTEGGVQRNGPSVNVLLYP